MNKQQLIEKLEDIEWEDFFYWKSILLHCTPISKNVEKYRGLKWLY